MTHTDQGGSGAPGYAFAGTAGYYVKFRVPYPQSLLKGLRERAGVTGAGRLLDLGCGPGRLTLALAPYFREVWAIDMEPEMVDAARQQADLSGARHIHWKLGKAEDLDAPASSFSLITAGEAFHRMDQPVVASKALRCLQSGCCLAILGSYSITSGREPWQRIVLDVLRRWSSQAVPAAGALVPGTRGSDPDKHERVLRDAGFAEVSSYPMTLEHKWTIDSILGFVFSTSIGSKPVLGKNVEKFESELRAELEAFDPSGTYGENIQWGYTLGRKLN